MLEVFARQPSGQTIAGAIEILIEEFCLNYRASPVLLASELASGIDTFKRVFPVSLAKHAGAWGRSFGIDMSSHAIRVAVDVDQLTLKVWEELGRIWRQDHPEYSPSTFLDFGGAEMWEKATAPPPTIMDLDDIEIESGHEERIHNQLFEGSARYRKGRIHELGIRPNHLTGEIFPGSNEAKPSAGPVRQEPTELVPADVDDAGPLP